MADWWIHIRVMNIMIISKSRSSVREFSFFSVIWTLRRAFTPTLRVPLQVIQLEVAVDTHVVQNAFFPHAHILRNEQRHVDADVDKHPEHDEEMIMLKKSSSSPTRRSWVHGFPCDRNRVRIRNRHRTDYTMNKNWLINNPELGYNDFYVICILVSPLVEAYVPCPHRSALPRGTCLPHQPVLRRNSRWARHS